MPYIPTNSINLATTSIKPVIRLGLQGASGSGKTFSALTFPNPVVLDFDNGCQRHAGRDITVIPFYNDKWCVEVLKCQIVKGQVEGVPATVVNKRDAFKKWLNEEGQKLLADQTLILDSFTTLSMNFDSVTDLQPSYSKDGSVDAFAFWSRKLDFTKDILQTLIGLNCHVVVCFHETCMRDPASGLLLEKVAPLSQGKSVAIIPLFFSDFFRQLAVDRKIKGPDGKEVVTGTDYLWQVKSSSQCNCKTRMKLKDGTTNIPANFESFTY